MVRVQNGVHRDVPNTAPGARRGARRGPARKGRYGGWTARDHEARDAARRLCPDRGDQQSWPGGGRTHARAGGAAGAAGGGRRETG